MKRLPPAKRNQLIMVIAITAALIGLVYFVLINPQNTKNTRLANDTKAAKIKLEQYKTTIKQADALANRITDVLFQLNRAEEDVATGDVYAWTYEKLRSFKTNYRLEIPNLGQPIPGTVDLLPNFPYSQVKITLNGTGFYHDLGKFVADFENNFPHMRLVNLQVDPSSGGPNSTPDRLSFHMEIIALVKPNT